MRKASDRIHLRAPGARTGHVDRVVRENLRSICYGNPRRIPMPSREALVAVPAQVGALNGRAGGKAHLDCRTRQRPVATLIRVCRRGRVCSGSFVDKHSWPGWTKG